MPLIACVARWKGIHTAAAATMSVTGSSGNSYAIDTTAMSGAASLALLCMLHTHATRKTHASLAAPCSPPAHQKTNPTHDVQGSLDLVECSAAFLPACWPRLATAEQQLYDKQHLKQHSVSCSKWQLGLCIQQLKGISKT